LPGILCARLPIAAPAALTHAQCTEKSADFIGAHQQIGFAILLRVLVHRKPNGSRRF
jgi:hypothetical protein